MTIDVVGIVWIFPIICFSPAATQYPGEADDVDSKIRSFISLCHFPASKGGFTTAGPDAIFFTQQKEMYPLIPLSVKTFKDAPPLIYSVYMPSDVKGGLKGLYR